jgi:hypothetical protein
MAGLAKEKQQLNEQILGVLKDASKSKSVKR